MKLSQEVQHLVFWDTMYVLRWTYVLVFVCLFDCYVQISEAAHSDDVQSTPNNDSCGNTVNDASQSQPDITDTCGNTVTDSIDLHSSSTNTDSCSNTLTCFQCVWEKIAALRSDCILSFIVVTLWILWCGFVTVGYVKWSWNLYSILSWSKSSIVRSLSVYFSFVKHCNWRDLNDILHKYSALLKRFSRSQVKGQRSWPNQLTYNGRAKRFNGLASMVLCILAANIDAFACRNAISLFWHCNTQR